MNLGQVTKGSGLAFLGRNEFGQLGDGTHTPRYSAVVVRTGDGGVLNGVEAIAAGDNYSLAVKQ